METTILGFSVSCIVKIFSRKSQIRCQKSRCEGYMSGLRGSLASNWSTPRQFWSLIGQWVSVSFEAWFRQWRENQYYPRLGQPGRTVTRELCSSLYDIWTSLHRNQASNIIFALNILIHFISWLYCPEIPAAPWRMRITDDQCCCQGR